MIRRALVVIALLLVSISLGATESVQPDKRALAYELIELTGGEKGFQQLLDAVLSGMQSSISQAPAEGESEAARENRETTHRIFNRFRELLATEFDFAQFRDEVLYPLYDKHFTAEELRDLVTFYETPTGRKTIEVMPVLMAESVQASTEFVTPTVERIMKRITREEELREPWRRTMRDIDSIASALDEYYDEYGTYPSVVELRDLESYLVPDYVDELPLTDVWGNPYTYVVSPDHENYRIISSAADGIVDWESRTFEDLDYDDHTPRLREDLRDDIVNQWGYYVQAPASSAHEWFFIDE